MTSMTRRVAAVAAVALPVTLVVSTVTTAPAAQAQSATPAKSHNRSVDVPESAPQAPAVPGVTPEAPAAPVAPAAPEAPAADTKGTSPDASGFADITWGPSTWHDRTLRHPRGGRFYPQVLRWANLVSAVMREKGIPPRYLRGILAQIQQESSGNQYAVNHWDSNASAGYPSKGLLQVIAPTYRAHAKPGFRSLRYQTIPYTNIWASLEYVLQNYGRVKFRKWNHGYNQGY
jgi:Transglycosylase SLT domain